MNVKLGEGFIDENSKWIEKQKENELIQELTRVTKDDKPTLFVEGTTDEKNTTISLEVFFYT